MGENTEAMSSGEHMVKATLYCKLQCGANYGLFCASTIPLGHKRVVLIQLDGHDNGFSTLAFTD